MKKKLPLLLILCALFLGAALFFFFKVSPAKEDITGYVPDLSTEYVVTQYADASGAQGTFYTIENDDYFLIIDGGWAENESAVRKVIAEHGNVVDAWIISHPHRDHAGAFNAIYANPGDIVIREIYDNGFDYDFIESVGEPYDDITVMETYHALTANATNITHLSRGEVLTICGLTFTILNVYDDTVLSNVGDEKDYQNNASLLFRVDSANSSMLFCSDIKYDMNDYLFSTCGGAGASGGNDVSSDSVDNLLACDYVQVGHHGNWSFSEDFYDATGASVFLFDAPSEITDNPDFPASSLKASLLAKNKTVLDFSTAPNRITLK